MNAPTRTVLSLKRPQEGDIVLEERLHKVLATAGLGSRRLLETRIEAGEVKVNGSAATLGSSLRPGDRVELDGKLFVAVTDNNENAEVLVYHKPEGVVTTRDDPEGRPTVFEQLPRLKGARWITIGRLDINTTGLLLLTTDGALAHTLMHPSTEVAREYICRVHGEVPDEALEKLQSGVELEDGPARFEELAIISRGDSHSWFRIVLREGRNREVRRMWESQGLMVSRLKRTRYGNVELPRLLRKGGCENLDADQVKALRQLVGATAPEPVLTLQPVINQRRAKTGNEFRPEPRAQQAWTGSSSHDEGRELRAFDRIRDDTPSRPGSRFNAKRGPNGGAPRGPGAGAGPRRNGGPGQGQRRGPAQGQGQGQRRGPGQEQGPWNSAGGNTANRGPSGPRGNANPNARGGPRRGPGNPQDAGGFQPRTWFPSPENGFTPPTGPRSGKPPRPGQGQGQRENAYGGANADRPRRPPPRDRAAPHGNTAPYGNSAPRENSAPRGNTAPRDFSAPRGNAAPGGPRGERRPPGPGGAGRPPERRHGNAAPSGNGNTRGEFRGNPGNGPRGNARPQGSNANYAGRSDHQRGPIDDNIGNRATPDNAPSQRRRGPPRRPG